MPRVTARMNEVPRSIWVEHYNTTDGVKISSVTLKPVETEVNTRDVTEYVDRREASVAIQEMANGVERMAFMLESLMEGKCMLRDTYGPDIERITKMAKEYRNDI